MDLATARSRLSETLVDLERSATTLTNEHAGDTSSELSSMDQHPADTASELSDQDREGAVLEVVQGQAEQVRAALGRIEAGNYGKCVDCRRQLPDERLEARPEAARCVSCQAKAEAAR